MAPGGKGKRAVNPAGGIALGLLLLLTFVGRARADERPLAIHYGEAGPFVELLEAELALVGVDLNEGPLPAPIDEGEALALRAETGAIAIIDHHGGRIALWIADGAGGLSERVLAAHDDPGLAPLILAETIRATLQERPRALPAAAWSPPPPELAEEPPPPAHEPAPPPVAEPPAPRRVAVSMGPVGLLGAERRAGLGIAGFLRLHPALAIGLRGIATRAPAGILALRAGLTLGPVRFAVEGGPAFWVVPRASNDSASRGPSVAPAWSLGASLGLAVAEHFAVEAQLGVLRRGPRHRAPGERSALVLGASLRYSP